MSEQYPAQPAPPAPVPVQPGPKKGFAVTALVLGIVAILGSWIPFLSIGSAFIGVIGLVFGVIAIVKAVKGTAGGKVMAIIGTALSGLAIIFAIISTTAGAVAVDDAFEELEGEIAVETEQPVPDETEPPADAAESEDAEAVEEEPSVGSLDDPATLGDGTVWTVESLGDEWDITFDAVQITEGFNGQVAIVTGTATPTVISEGDTSSWASFPSIGWMAEGAAVDDTFDIPQGDVPGDDYRHVVDLEATAGTTLKFYSSVGLPDGIAPEYLTVETLFGDDVIYFATGL